MKWVSAMSEQPNLEEAIEECAENIILKHGDAAPDLAVTFVSPHHEAGYEKVSGLLKRLLWPAKVFGC